MFGHHREQATATIVSPADKHVVGYTRMYVAGVETADGQVLRSGMTNPRTWCTSARPGGGLTPPGPRYPTRDTTRPSSTCPISGTGSYGPAP